MREEIYYKLADAPPATLAEVAGVEDEAFAFLAPEQSVADYIANLAGAGLYSAAIAVLAHALPKREAVWWGCVALRHAEAPQPGSPSDAALAAAEAWVYTPDEQHRRPTQAAAAGVGLDTPAGWAAMAAFFSGGSVAPPDSAVVPPRDDLTGRAVAGAITLAASHPNAGRSTDLFEIFIGMAFEIARGGDGRHVAA